MSYQRAKGKKTRNCFLLSIFQKGIIMKYYLIIRLFERKKRSKGTVAMRVVPLKVLMGFKDRKKGEKISDDDLDSRLEHGIFQFNYRVSERERKSNKDHIGDKSALNAWYLRETTQKFMVRGVTDSGRRGEGSGRRKGRQIEAEALERMEIRRMDINSNQFEAFLQLQYLPQKKEMINQSTAGFYFVPVTMGVDMQGFPLAYYPEKYYEVLLAESYRLKMEQSVLLNQLQQHSQERERMVAENVQLREEALRSENKIKRKYRKRRTWLQKKYRCNVKGCSNKYSSKIALNSHKRKKHPKRGQQS